MSVNSSSGGGGIGGGIEPAITPPIAENDDDDDDWFGSEPDVSVDEDDDDDVDVDACIALFDDVELSRDARSIAELRRIMMALVFGNIKHFSPK